ETTLKKFNEEILLHSQQRHPNIVQLIGVYYPPRSKVPMLVMEYLPFTLRESLEHHKLPLQMKYSILSDVAKGLCYLHGKRPAIVHRDLTANNVLLTPLYSAKISDLGVSRLIDKFKSHQQLTQVPGNAIVMPPEALATKPVYNEKVDVFTYGCLILHVLTCQFPEPTDAFVQYFMFWQSKVAEWDRRSKYIQKIPEDEKDFLPLAKQCLQDNPSTRPDMSQVLQSVEEKCTKSNETLLHIIREKDKAKDTMKLLALSHKKQIEAKEDEIDEKELKLEKTKREKDLYMNQLHVFKSKYKADMAVKEAEIATHIAKKRIYGDIIERRKLVQTWLGRIVESLEEKSFQIRVTRPLLFNSLFLVPIAIVAIAILLIIFFSFIYFGFWLYIVAVRKFFDLLTLLIKNYDLIILLIFSFAVYKCFKMLH
ncbi:PREDICTED: cysteine-rich receptor-like protein kinase 13, partial [Amphimedon queenslandica]|uniref:Protein kinase domain-containing protein n=1 Tax=Amphimedon queenslandica TaxID=400682 RepID=A0A1X7TJJ0_AMPQE